MATNTLCSACLQVSELIHKSDTFPDLDYCRVSVHFCDIIDHKNDEDEYTVVPDSSLVVTRIAYKNNSSKYLVDDKVSSFTEVGVLLRKRGIDLDNNRFLILQGEVEQIAMMQPMAKNEHDDGLLEFLEDIIGSNRHLEKINESEKALEVLNEGRGDKLARLRVTESERDNLEGAKKEAEDSVRKGREVRVKQNILYQKHAGDAAAHATEAKNKHAEIEEKRKHEAEKLAEKTVVMEEKEAEAKSITAEHESIRQQLEKSKKEFNAFDRQDIKLREDIKSNKETKKKLKAAMKKEEEKIVTATSKAEEIEASLPGLQTKIASTAEARTEKETSLEALLETVRDETDKLREAVENKTVEIAPVKQKMAEVEASIGTTETEITLVKQTATSAKAELAKCESELARVTKDAAMKREAVMNADAEIGTKEARLGEIADELNTAARRETELSEAMTAAVARSEEAKAQLASQGSVGRGVVGKILAAAKPGKELAKVRVLGRLGDLGAIPSEFDVAVSTACGYVSLNACLTQNSCLRLIFSFCACVAGTFLTPWLSRRQQTVRRALNS